MSRYWYFSATLPGLLLGAQPPMSGPEFLALCGRLMTKEDFGEVAGALEYLKGKEPAVFRSSFLEAFVAWEKNFRNELARLRARRSGRNEEEFLRPAERADEAGRAAASCFAVEDPYQAELILEQERWAAIERLSSRSSFDLDFIVAYRLKLAINERLGSLDAKTGSAGYEHLYQDIIGGVSSTAETDNPGEQA